MVRWIGSAVSASAPSAASTGFASAASSSVVSAAAAAVVSAAKNVYGENQQIITDEYAKDDEGAEDMATHTEAGEKQSTLLKSIANEVIQNTVEVKMDKYYNKKKRRYTIYVCLEYDGDVKDMVENTVKKIRSRIPEKDRKRIDEHLEKFEFEIEQELNNIKTVLKEQEYNKFIDEQISKGTLLPANKRTILSIFNELDNIKQFGEDSTAVSGFQSFIESLNPRIEFKETAVKSKQISVKAESDKFSDADEESLAVFQEAKNLAEKENITFKEALLKLNI